MKEIYFVLLVFLQIQSSAQVTDNIYSGTSGRLISATAVSQVNQLSAINPKIEKVKAVTIKGFTGLYAIAGVGDSWESDIINNRRDETVSPSLGPITYERVSVKSLSGAGTVEGGFGYNFGNNLRAELTYLFKAKSAGTEATTGTVFYAGGSFTFKGDTRITGTINKHAFLANVYYDLPIKSRWVPFIGAGLGIATVNSTDMLYNYDVVYSNGNRVIGSRNEPGGMGNALAYQAKIGINYLISKKTAVFLGGNYFHINRIDLGGGTIYEGFNIFGAKVGLMYRFAKKNQ